MFLANETFKESLFNLNYLETSVETIHYTLYCVMDVCSNASCVYSMLYLSIASNIETCHSSWCLVFSLENDECDELRALNDT